MAVVNPLTASHRNLDGSNVLLDGGGIRGLSMLYIIKVLMNHLEDAAAGTRPMLPCDYFDLIVGTSTGG